MAPKVSSVRDGKLPGHESKLSPKPKWQPLYPGSGRLAGKVVLITGACNDSSYMSGQVLHPNGGTIVNG